MEKIIKDNCNIIITESRETKIFLSTCKIHLQILFLLNNTEPIHLI